MNSDFIFNAKVQVVDVEKNDSSRRIFETEN
jgi:hypothetical protein